MDEDELLLQGDDGAAVITDNFDEDQLLHGSINGDAGSTTGEHAGHIFKMESLDHEELDYEEEDEKEERESKFTSERSKKSPIRAPEEAAAAAASKPNENAGVAVRGSYRGGRVMRGGAGFSSRGGMGGNFNMRGGMRMVAGGGSAGPISLLHSNIPPPMMMAGPPGMGGPLGKILVNPNFPVGANLSLLPNPGFGAPPMGLRGPMMPHGPIGPKVTLSIDGAPALAVPVQRAPSMQMGPRPGAPMQMPPPNLTMRPGGIMPQLVLNNNPMGAPPPSAMRFPPGMGPPPMAMNVPPPGMVAQMAGTPQGANWNLMVEAFLGDKKASGGGGSGERSKKKRRRRSRSSSYSSSSDSESSFSESSRSRSRSRSPRRTRKRTSRGTRKHHKERSGAERGERSGRKGDRGERRVFRTGPNSFRINSAPTNGSELPSLMDGMERGNGGGRDQSSSKSRRADRERQRETDSRDSARVLGLDDDYLSRVEDQRRQREEMRRRRERNDRSEGGGARESSNHQQPSRDRAPASSSSGSRNDSNGAAAAKDSKKKAAEPVSSDESKRKAYLAVHVRNIGNLGEAALGRVKALANEVGETKKVWRSADDVVTVIFVELDKAKAFMLKYNGKVLSGLRITVGLEKVYLNLSEVHDR